MDNIKLAYDNGDLTVLTKEEIEKNFILKDGTEFNYIGESYKYHETIIIETKKGNLEYIYQNKIMDRLRKKDEENDIIMILK